MTDIAGLHRKIAALVVGEFNADTPYALGIVVGEGMGRNGMVAEIVKTACARTPSLKSLTLVDNPAFMTTVRQTLGIALGEEPTSVTAPGWTPKTPGQHGITTLQGIEKVPERVVLGGFDIVIVVNSKGVRAVEQRRAIRKVCELRPRVFVAWLMTSTEELHYFPKGMVRETVDVQQL